MCRPLHVIFAVAILSGLLLSRPAHAERVECFAETGFCVSGRFLSFWEGNGGLAVFGLPLGPARQEQTPDGTLLVQYFERQRFEYHPVQRPPYDVLLGRLGADALSEPSLPWQSLPRARASAPHYFAETGHAIAGEFWGYWSSHGLQLDGGDVSYAESLALFGFPISELLLERNRSGHTVAVQYFERARLELHPANEPAYRVLQGHLGGELLQRAAGRTYAGGPQIYPLIADQGRDPYCLFAVNAYLSGGPMARLAEEYYRRGLPTWDGRTPYNENILALTQSLYGAHWRIWPAGDWEAARRNVVEGHPTAFTGHGHAIVVLSMQAGSVFYVDSLHAEGVQVMSEAALRSWWDGWAWYNEREPQAW